jgi:probable HAF family extracellular repeat protein
VFLPLGDLPGGGFASEARDISADGSIVVGTGTNSTPSPSLPGGFEFEAFRWTSATGLEGLGTDLGVRGTAGGAISGDGSVIAGFIFDEYPDRSIFTWTQSSGMTRLTGCSCVEFDSVEAISHNGGVIVGRMRFSNGFRAYRWTAQSGAFDLGVFPGGAESNAHDVSYDGSVIVGHSQTARFFQAFRWTAQDGMQFLGTPAPNGNSSAWATSADGSVIVGDREQEAVRWVVDGTSADVFPLGDLPGGSTYGYGRAISADGSVVVGSSSSAHGFEAFRWTEASGMRSLQDILVQLGVEMNGYRIQYATGISADGSVIVGTAINPQGNSEAYLAVVPAHYVPEPSGALLAFVAVGFIQVTRRCRGRLGGTLRIGSNHAAMQKHRSTWLSRRVLG